MKQRCHLIAARRHLLNTREESTRSIEEVHTQRREDDECRQHYDQESMTPVMSTIEDWRMGSGPGGKLSLFLVLRDSPTEHQYWQAIRWPGIFNGAVWSGDAVREVVNDTLS